jgi:flagellar hook-basal body complex protein FliE
MNKSRPIIPLRVDSFGWTGRTSKGDRAQRHAREGLEFEKQLKQVMAQSRREQKQSSERASDMDIDEKDDDEFELSRERSENDS